VVSLPSITKEVCTKHRCHTLILYGSWARGDATTVSDCDLLAIRKGGIDVVRDARKWRGIYLDVFVYPEKKVKAAELLRVRGGKVLKQQRQIGDRLLAQLDRIYRRGPKSLPADELAARKVWLHKMLERALIGDTEGNFRRVWMLTALLEDYFVFRNRWYEGPKLGLQWLRENEPRIHKRFEQALRPGSDFSILQDLVAAVTK
jgi:hypothetical protein